MSQQDVGTTASRETRSEWITRHFDLHHSISKRDEYDECSCGATYWRISPAHRARTPDPAMPEQKEEKDQDVSRVDSHS